MKAALLIHGYNGIPKIFDYFKSELEKLDYNVIMPSLPVRSEISFDCWESKLNELTIPLGNLLLIAHSVGNEFMIRYCAKYDIKIKTYIGLAGFVESFVHESRDDLNKVIANMQCTEQEISKFKKLSDKRYAIYSNNDHIVPYDILKNFSVKIAASPIMIPDIGHMGSKSGLVRLTEVIKLVKLESKQSPVS